MKYIIVAKEQYSSIAEEVKTFITGTGNEVEAHTAGSDLDYVAKIVEVSKSIAEAKREGIALISFDETGGLGFVSASKVKGMISSQISDEHSSHMTREHNGSVGLNLGADLLSITMIKSIVKYYVEEKFAAGRHMVRVDMLDSMC